MTSNSTKKAEEAIGAMLASIVAFAVSAVVSRIFLGRRRFRTMARRTAYATAVGAAAGFTLGAVTESETPDSSSVDEVAFCTSIGAIGAGLLAWIAHLFAGLIRW